jgi:hypothetical protein
MTLRELQSRLATDDTQGLPVAQCSPVIAGRDAERKKIYVGMIVRGDRMPTWNEEGRLPGFESYSVRVSEELKLLDGRALLSREGSTCYVLVARWLESMDPSSLPVYWRIIARYVPAEVPVLYNMQSVFQRGEKIPTH